MAQLSDRLNRLAPSATLAMSQKSSEMKEKEEVEITVRTCISGNILKEQECPIIPYKAYVVQQY